MTKRRAFAALIGLVLIAAIAWGGMSWARRASSAGPPPEVIGPGVLLQSTAASYDRASAAFSRDGQIVAIGVVRTVDDHHPGEVWLWDDNGSRVRTILTAEMGTVRSIAFAPDGKSLVVASSRSVVMWDVPPASAGTPSPVSGSPNTPRHQSQN